MHYSAILTQVLRYCVHFLLFIFLLILQPASAFAQKTLHWDKIEVVAHLDQDGQLHVKERHYMVFNGDWNGGERFFDTRGQQRFTLQGMYVIDPVTGQPGYMTAGDLSKVNHYSEVSTGKIRWRSRLPTDPPFQSALQIYEIQGTYDRVLQELEPGNYVFDHDFAFKDRPGVIKQFDLKLTLDPIWQSTKSVDLSRHVTNMAPGTSYTLRLALTYRGQNKPANVAHGQDRKLIHLVYQLLIAFVILRLGLFFLSERARGKFQKAIPTDMIDSNWLQANLFSRAPEEAGTQLALGCEGPQLAAALMRMVNEGKLHADKRGDELGRLSIPAPRPAFSDYEAKLIETLFEGETTLDTEKLRERSSRDKLTQAMTVVDEQYLSSSIFKIRLGPILTISRLLTLTFLGGAAYFGYVTMQQDVEMGILVLPSLFHTVIGLVLLSIFARKAGKSPNFAYVTLTILALLMLGYFKLAYEFLGVIDRDILTTGYLYSLSLAAMVFNMVMNIASSQLQRDALDLHRAYRSAIQYFSQVMKQDITRIRDEWWPYIVAFGLGKEAQRWVDRYEDTRSTNHDSGMDSSSSSDSSERPWRGGGGSFGAAGATGAWLGLGGAIDSAARPESSSSPSDSSSDSSSSSSGGGSGGGW